MREFTNYYGKVSTILGGAILEIDGMFQEHNVNEIHLDSAISLGFISRITEDYQTCEISTIGKDGDFIVLCTPDSEKYYLYDLANKMDIAFIYDIVYTHFYKKAPREE